MLADGGNRGVGVAVENGEGFMEKKEGKGFREKEKRAGWRQPEGKKVKV